MKTREQFHAYIVELLTTGDESISRSVAQECATQIIETLDAQQPEPVAWMIRHKGCAVGCVETVFETAVHRARNEGAAEVEPLYAAPFTQSHAAFGGPKAVGVSRLRDGQDPKVAEKILLVSFERRPTDDELRAIHELLAGRTRSATRCTEWQPINTAPKDRNIILTDGKVVGEGGWITDVEQGAEYEGQAGMAGWWCITNISDGKPTHWMPLPAKPVCVADRGT